MNVDIIRASIYKYSQEKSTILLWEDSIREYLHKKNLDYNDVNKEFLLHECTRGFLEPYQENGYRITRQGIVVYRKMSGAPSRGETSKKIKKALETLDEGAGLTIREISEVLQISESAAQNNVTKMVNAGKIVILGTTRPKRYTLAGQKQLFF